MFQLFGITFHVYGLFVGAAVSFAVLLGEKVSAQNKDQAEMYWPIVWVLLLGGVIGARLYHVWTDWSLYAGDIQRIPQIWQGGLSIIGALFGGIVSLFFFLLWKLRNFASIRKSFLYWADVVAVCIPWAQAVGRLGNWANQELYGTPTTLPWGIFIDPAHRIAGYEGVSYFHPLFAYEALGMLLFGGVLWHMYRTKRWKLGEGKFFLSYCAWYGMFRGSLEFLRVDKATLKNLHLGLNQVVLYVIGVCSLGGLVQQICRKKSSSSP